VRTINTGGMAQAISDRAAKVTLWQWAGRGFGVEKRTVDQPHTTIRMAKTDEEDRTQTASGSPVASFDADRASRGKGCQ